MIRLVPMTETEFQSYLDFAIAHYAEEHVKAGNWQSGDALRAYSETGFWPWIEAALGWFPNKL